MTGTALRRTAMPLLLLCALLLGPLTGPAGAQDLIDRSDHARLLKGRWADPGPEHTIEPQGTITERLYPKWMVTKLPEDLETDLTMTIRLELDTTKGTEALLRFNQRSATLGIEPYPEDWKENIIQPSAIDGTKATVRVKVTADYRRLNHLKPVYFERIEVWLAGAGSKRARLDWTWKPYGKHEDKLLLAPNL